MKIVVWFLLGFLILTLFTGFYYYYFQALPMKAELYTLRNENKALSEEMKRIAEEKKEAEKQAEKVKHTYQSLIDDMKDEIKNGEIKISELSGKLKVNIVDKILFDSGEATVSKNGKKILARLGNILKRDTSKVIRVEGHTDNVKIHPKLKKKFPTNWELSTSRATNVVRFLRDQLKIEGERLEAAGYAEFRPVASNKTASGRAKNRRIEILFVPK